MIFTVDIADPLMTSLPLCGEILRSRIPLMYYIKNVEAVRPTLGACGNTFYLDIERLMDGDQYLLF